MDSQVQSQISVYLLKGRNCDQDVLVVRGKLNLVLNDKRTPAKVYIN